jgi:uncharacterized coiled-coil protein SlyX
MDWFQSKTTQIITLVSIIGTLVGFGVTGGSYINRLENLEVKIGGLGETESEMKVIEERFASIETSVQFLEKEIDNISVPDVTEIKTDIATIKADLQSLDSNLSKVEDKLDKKDSNPLNG